MNRSLILDAPLTFSMRGMMYTLIHKFDFRVILEMHTSVSEYAYTGKGPISFCENLEDNMAFAERTMICLFITDCLYPIRTS